MNAAQIRRAAEQQVNLRCRALDYSPEEIEERVEEQIADWIAEDARERQENGYDAAPSLADCDDAGTGEGRFHGRV